ncbi:MAG: DUF1127 domain-containing protein [Rhizobiales bacterium]|nr:DUF1127 domain-containing protein [Hyphomicrobiales bacterium]
MRNYTETQAIQMGVHPRQALLPRLWRSWRARRSVRLLERMDDHMLRDMGLTREDLRWAQRLPLAQDAGAALEDLRLRVLRGR